MKFFRYLFGRQCMLCGRTVEPVLSHGVCAVCEGRIAEERLVIPSGENRNSVAIYYYEDPVRRGLHRFKYRGRIEWGWACAELLAERSRERGEAIRAVLTKLGVEAERMTVVPLGYGYGDFYTNDQNPDGTLNEDIAPLNRNVHLVLGSSETGQAILAHAE